MVNQLWFTVDLTIVNGVYKPLTILISTITIVKPLMFGN